MTIKSATKTSGPSLEASLRRLVANIGDKLQVGLVGPKATALHDGSELSVVAIGTIHEFGDASEDIPARPWIMQSLRGDRRTIVGISSRLQVGLAKVMSGKLKQRTVLNEVGKYASGQMREYLLHGPHLSPELAPATVASKTGRGLGDPSRPLVATAQMAGAISWKVGESEEAD